MRHSLPCFVLALILPILSFAVIENAVADSPPPGNQPDRKSVRIGTFDSRAVAIAYFRSKLHDQWLMAANTRYKKAKESGNHNLARQIEKDCEADQANAHRQKFGVGPYSSLVEQLKPIWPQVLKSSGVELIVPEVYAASPDIQTVDVTETILQQLGADAKTRGAIESMKRKIRSGQYDPATFKGEH